MQRSGGLEISGRVRQGCGLVGSVCGSWLVTGGNSLLWPDCPEDVMCGKDIQLQRDEGVKDILLRCIRNMGSQRIRGKKMMANRVNVKNTEMVAF